MSKVIHAFYTDDDLVLEAVKEARSKNYKVREVFCPFPVHGLDKAMGLKPTRLAITSFLYGVAGLALAIWMTNYMMIQDWPQNIGGKPSFTWWENMPSFVVVMFELAVFFAGHFMVITFYLRSRIWPFKKAENPDPRTTDDHFLMEVELGDHDTDVLTQFLTSTGAVEINILNE